MCAAIACAGVFAGAAQASDVLKDGEFPNWIPSLGAGFGLQSRDVHARIDNPDNPFAQFASLNPIFGGAFLKTDIVNSEPRFRCRPSGQFAGFCFFLADATEALDGGTLPLGGQLIGPAEPFLGLVRPFIHGAYAIDFDSRVIASSGFKPGGFPTTGPLPKMRVQVEARPQSTWWAGGGIAVQVPIDIPVFLKFGYNYSKHEMDLEGDIWRGIVINNEDAIRRTNAKDDLSITSWGPSFGVEAEVWRIGQIAMNLSADLLVFFPRDGTDTRFSLEQPRTSGDPPQCSSSPNPPSNCLQPAFFSVDADETQYHGSLSLRLVWLGVPF
jgi:hypothetical protein